MEIIIPKFNIDISGKVHLLIYDKKGRIKRSQHFNNAIHDNLKDAFVNHIAGSSASSHHINTSSIWLGDTHSEQDGKDGIFIWQSDSNSQVKSYEALVSSGEGFDLKLDESTSTTYGGSNSCIWQAEGTWTGQEGLGSTTSGSFNKMQIGKDFDLSNSDVPSFGTTFATAESSGDFTAFTLDDNDVCRVTWTITIS